MNESDEGMEITETAVYRWLSSLWFWAGVVVVGCLIGGMRYGFVARECRLAREDFDRALADYRAAGFPDPFVMQTPAMSAPSEAEGNLLRAPLFDGLAVIGGGSGRYSSYSFNEGAAIRSKVDEVGQFTFGAPGAPFWSLDLAAHFARKPTRSRLVSDLKTDQSLTQAFVIPLEREFPQLKSLEAIEMSHPYAAVEEPTRVAMHAFEMPFPEFQSARATAMVLTAYAGAKALEGDGAPASAAVCGMARGLAESRAEGTLVSAMIRVVVAKLSLPRLTHLAIRDGLWTDAQLRRASDCLGRLHFANMVKSAILAEMRDWLVFLKHAGDGDPEALATARRIKQAWWAEDMNDAFDAPYVWRNGAAQLRVMRGLSATSDAGSRGDAAKLVACSDSLELMPRSGACSFVKFIFPAFSKVLANAVIADAQVTAARLACCLESYRREHGMYPEKLDELVPRYLPAVPASPWAGGHLTYATTSTGYTLTWPKADYFDSGMGGVKVDVEHPGPWEVFGYKIELPARVCLFDTRNVTTSVASPKDIVWTMPVPKSR